MESIFVEYSALTQRQIDDLRQNAPSQNDFILNILKADPTVGYALFQMIEITGIHYSSVNRALSSMSSRTGKKAKKFMDDDGRMPIIKRTDQTAYNPQTDKTCSTYWYNENYGKPCGQQGLFD